MWQRRRQKQQRRGSSYPCASEHIFTPFKLQTHRLINIRATHSGPRGQRARTIIIIDIYIYTQKENIHINEKTVEWTLIMEVQISYAPPYERTTTLQMQTYEYIVV